MAILRAFVPLLVIWLLTARAAAQSPTALCVTVRTPRADAAQFRRLVEVEVDRHPSHLVVSEGCAQTLFVEVIEVAVGTFLTGRIGSHVPHRIAVGRDGLAAALEELVAVVLENDPFVLERSRREGLLAASLGKLRKEGHALAGAEVFQWFPLVGGRWHSLPGIGGRYRRETGALQVGARLTLAFPMPAGERAVRPTFGAAAHAEASVASSASADAALLAGVLVGVEHVRFEGPAPLAGPGARGEPTLTSPSIGMRVGFEAFRVTTTRLDAFAQATLPVLRARDADGGVIDAWVPGFSVGMGVAF